MKAGMIQVAMLVEFLLDKNNTPVEKIEFLGYDHGKVAKDEIKAIILANTPAEDAKPEEKLAAQKLLDTFAKQHPLDGSSSDTDGTNYTRPWVKSEQFERAARQIKCIVPTLGMLRVKNADDADVKAFCEAINTIARLTKSYAS